METAAPKPISVLDELSDVQAATHQLIAQLEARLYPVINHAEQKAALEGKALVDNANHAFQRLDTQYQINSRLRDILDSLVV